MVKKESEYWKKIVDFAKKGWKSCIILGEKEVKWLIFKLQVCLWITFSWEKEFWEAFICDVDLMHGNWINIAFE